MAKVIFNIGVGSGKWALSTYCQWVVWHYVSRALKIWIHFDPVILLLGLYTKEIKEDVHKDLRARIFVKASSIIAKQLNM